MTINNGDEIFSKAYTAYQEQKFDDAAVYSREYINKYPNSTYYINMLVLLGSVLDQDGESNENILESKKLFIKAINSSESIPELMDVDGSADADPILHLGIWEARRGNNDRAIAYLLIDYLLSPVKTNSEELLFKLIQDVEDIEPNIIQNLIKRIGTEYKIAKA